ncbi:MAG TPA: nucleotidyltransferase family protein [Bryobacteraceae bacterium]|nr:nucleotidyltransferase family protein [Bryobacteraceae bacterium]
MQCVILAGGLGTRMRPLTDACPKTLLPVAGRPFAWHQMQWLAAQGIDDVVYCIAHQGEQIRQYWATELAPIRSLRYVDEETQLRGTGGALRLALDEGVLDESFFVLYGDSFLPVEFEPVWSAFESSGSPALMTVLKNQGRWDRSNVIFEGGRVKLYTKNAEPSTQARMQYIDYGLSVLRRDVIAGITETIFDLSAVFHRLSVEGRLAGYEVTERFYEIGSPEGLRELERYLMS